MRFRVTMALFAALTLLAIPALVSASEATVTAPTTAHRVVVNGQTIANPVLHENRLYVPADSFAAAIGGEMTKDDNGVYWINTGEALPTKSELAKLNPALDQYEMLSPFVPGMGIHEGTHGPGLILVVSNEGTINAFEIMVPAEQGWLPWFDQPENEPMDMHEMGKVYTQHIYLTSPAGLLPEGAGVPVIIDGRYLSSGYSLKSHMQGDKVYIPLRSAVELLGGDITWNQNTYTAIAAVESRGISFDWLAQLNPALKHYEPISPFVPDMGFHYGVGGPHITVLVDSAGMVNGFELVVPQEGGWFPWFDQPEGEPMDLHGVGWVYTQHIYLVDPTTIK